MTNSLEFVGEKLKIYRKSATGYFDACDVTKFHDFLNDYLKEYIFPRDIQLSENEIIERLQIVQKSARCLAVTFLTYKSMSKNGIPDSEIIFKEIVSHQQKQLSNLKDHIDGILKIISDTDLPLEIVDLQVDANIIVKCDNPNCGNLKKFSQPSLGKKLQYIGKHLQELIKPETTETDKKNKKRSKAPIRGEIISTLTNAWIDITNKPPERLKRNTGIDKTDQSYGEFKDYMKAGLKLFKAKIYVEEAIKEAYPHFLKRLVNEASVFIIPKADKELSKIKNGVDYDKFHKEMLTTIEKNTLFKPSRRPSRKQKDRSVIDELIKDVWKIYG